MRTFVLIATNRHMAYAFDSPKDQAATVALSTPLLYRPRGALLDPNDDRLGRSFVPDSLVTDLVALAAIT